MTTRLTVLLLAGSLGGCVPLLQQNQSAALAAARSRGQFELNCAQVTPTIISQKTVEGIRWELAEYTVGVRGCGRQAIYLTYCRDPSDCNAIAQTGRVQAVP